VLHPAGRVKTKKSGMAGPWPQPQYVQVCHAGDSSFWEEVWQCTFVFKWAQKYYSVLASYTWLPQWHEVYHYCRCAHSVSLEFHGGGTCLKHRRLVFQVSYLFPVLFWNGLQIVSFKARSLMVDTPYCGCWNSWVSSGSWDWHEFWMNTSLIW